MLSVDSRSTLTETYADDVESLIASPEPEGIFRDSAECGGALLLLALLLVAPPAPRPKNG